MPFAAPVSRTYAVAQRRTSRMADYRPAVEGELRRVVVDQYALSMHADSAVIVVNVEIFVQRFRDEQAVDRNAVGRRAAPRINAEGLVDREHGVAVIKIIILQRPAFIHALVPYSKGIAGVRARPDEIRAGEGAHVAHNDILLFDPQRATDDPEAEAGPAARV